jgi:hypothetical protein
MVKAAKEPVKKTSPRNTAMIAAARLFQARTNRVASVSTNRLCRTSRVSDRRCLLLSDERRDCLARLRQTALAETADFLNARLVK